MIVGIAGQKGGSGKSCLAQNVSVGLALRGHQVTLIDADAQRTSADWAEERESSPEALASVGAQAMSGDLTRTLLDLPSANTYVVDCGGRDSKEMRSTMVAADVLVLPLRAKRRDLKTLHHLAEVIDQARILNPDLVVRAVITQAPTLPSQYPRIWDAKEVASSYGIESLEPVIFSRNVYDDAEEAGLSVYEASDPKAIEEINAVIDGIFEIRPQNENN